MENLMKRMFKSLNIENPEIKSTTLHDGSKMSSFAVSGLSFEKAEAIEKEYNALFKGTESGPDQWTFWVFEKTKKPIDVWQICKDGAAKLVVSYGGYSANLILMVQRQKENQRIYLGLKFMDNRLQIEVNDYNTPIDLN